LYKQLSEQHQKLTLDIREQTESLSHVTKKREQLGVELYSFQQGLAKLQLELQKSHEKFNAAQDMRAASEVALKKANSEYEAATQQKNATEQKRSQAQKELDKLRITMQQISEFNEKVRGEILVTRRAAYGTEENMQRLERQKKKQDEVIDQLNEQLKSAKDNLKLLEAQIQSQSAESAQARATLAEAQKEINTIGQDKKEYLQKWKASLVGMANRDNALQAVQEALQKRQAEAININLSTKAIKRSIQAEQEKNEGLQKVLARVDAEVYNQVTSLCAMYLGYEICFGVKLRRS
jgi:chromosome segregation ATPase